MDPSDDHDALARVDVLVNLGLPLIEGVDPVRGVFPITLSTAVDGLSLRLVLGREQLKVRVDQLQYALPVAALNLSVSERMTSTFSSTSPAQYLAGGEGLHWGRADPATAPQHAHKLEQVANAKRKEPKWAFHQEPACNRRARCSAGGVRVPARARPFTARSRAVRTSRELPAARNPGT